MSTGNFLPLKSQLNFYLGKKEGEERRLQKFRITINDLEIKVKFIKAKLYFCSLFTLK